MRTARPSHYVGTSQDRTPADRFEEAKNQVIRTVWHAAYAKFRQDTTREKISVQMLNGKTRTLHALQLNAGMDGVGKVRPYVYVTELERGILALCRGQEEWNIQQLDWDELWGESIDSALSNQEKDERRKELRIQSGFVRYLEEILELI